MRAIRGRVGIVAALVAAIALALSALAGLATRPVGVPGDGPWVITLSHPDGGWEACLDDPALGEGQMTADLPVSRVSVPSAPAATADDVRRVVGCLSDSMSGGTIEIATAAR